MRCWAPRITDALRRLALAVLFCATASCATIVRGTKADVLIESTPPGAEIMTGPNKASTTPRIVTIDRDKPTDVTVILDGYEDGHARIQRSVNPWFVLFDVLLCPFGCISLIADIMSGAYYDVEPQRNFDLKKLPAPAPPASSSVPVSLPPPPSAAQPKPKPRHAR